MRPLKPFVTAALVFCLSAFTIAQDKAADKSAAPKAESAKAAAKAPEEKQWLYRIQPSRFEMVKTGPTPDEAKALQGHGKYMTELTANGTLILAGRTQNDDESMFGIVIFRAPDEETARKIMNGDPGVAQGVMKAKLFPYVVAFKGK
jgi:uncharacterized protein YciI